MYQRRFSRRLVAQQKNMIHLDEQLEADGVHNDTKPKLLEDLAHQDCKGINQLGVVCKQVCKGINQLGLAGKQVFKGTQQLEDIRQQGFEDTRQLGDMGQQEQLGAGGQQEQLGAGGQQEQLGAGGQEQLGAGGQEQLGAGRQQECEEVGELESAGQLCEGIGYDVNRCMDEDTKINVMKLDENKNVLYPNVAVENIWHIPAISVSECVMVHKPKTCEENDNTSRASFLRGLFPSDDPSVPMKGISISKCSNSVDGDYCKSTDNSYNTSIENDLVVKRFKSEGEPNVLSPEKLQVTGESNDQEIMEIEIEVDAVNVLNSEIKSDSRFGSFTGREDLRQNLRSVENTNQTHNILDAPANGEQDQLANGEQDDELANGEHDDFFENRFCEGFHNAMGMAVVDMQTEEKPSTVNRPNVPCNSEMFGVSELSWRLGTICCDSVHTDVAAHVASHHHEATKFKCNGCKIKFSESRLFLDHINNHHSAASSSLKCLENKCRLLFPTAFSLKIHQQEYHVEETERMRMKCNTCSKKVKEDTKNRGEVFVPHIGEHAIKVHRELWI